MSSGWVQRRAGRTIAWILAVPVVLLVVLAVFPWGLVVRHAAAPLSAALGRTVSIGSARRIDTVSFVPQIELRDVRIAQPAWAGAGDMARIAAVRLKVPIFPLLLGHVRPRAIEADGLALNLVRDAAGRDNWSGRKAGGRGSSGPRLADLTIRDGRLRLVDAKRHVTLQAMVASDRAHGLRIVGAGSQRGTPLRLAVAAAAIEGADPAKPYPARLIVRSPLASLDARVTMDHPLDTGHFSGRIVASGRDLSDFDDIVQIGLFHTQPFRLSAAVRHDGRDWRVPRLDATIGRSALSASLTVTKPQGRTRLDGRVDARTLDFGDFASDEQKARAAATKRRIGARVVPDTRIVLDKLGKLDGRLSIKVATLVSETRSPFRSLAGTVVLDDRRLAIAPLTVGLPQGRASGTITVDGRGRVPKLTLDLRIAGATVNGFFPDQQVVAGPLRARIRLAGSGPTVRDALAHAGGRVALVVADGTVRRDYATFLGGDVFKSVGAAAAGKAPRIGLDCLIGRFGVTGGLMTPAPLLLSTPVARGDGQGSIRLGPESIDLRIVGRSTRPGLLSSTAPVRLFGTLSHPMIDIRPPRAEDQAKSGVLERVGFFVRKLRIRGDADVKAAAPVDCPAAIAAALR